jgi:glycerol-3-phosphate acyltransferase PlsX
MGGDHAPEEIVLGGIEAARSGVDVLAVGDDDAVRAALNEAGGRPAHLQVVHTTQVVDMDEAPGSAMRRKKDSSLRVAFELVKEGKADAVVTMGNSGAALGMGVMVLGKCRGVERPAFLTVWPSRSGRMLVLDVGANPDCKASYLNQFGTMGTVAAQVAVGIPKPRVGLLSNGTEDEKGTDLTREAKALLAANQLVDFRGYVEGNHLFDGLVDVVVTDGFTGNVLLKAAEGVFSYMGWLIKDTADGRPGPMLGGLLMQPAFREVRETVENHEFGGALLVGVRCPCVVGHGRARRGDVAHAVRYAERVAKAGLVDAITERLDSIHNSP